MIEAEKAEEKLMSSWYPKVITLFSDSKLLPKLPKDRMDGFFECSSTLIGNQVDKAKFIILRDITVFVVEATSYCQYQGLRRTI